MNHSLKQVSESTNQPVFSGFSCDKCRIINIDQKFNGASECSKFCKENYQANAAQYISSDPGSEGVFFSSPYYNRCSCIVDAKKVNLYNNTFSDSQQLFLNN